MYSWLESTFENQVFCRRALQILIFCHYLSCTSHFPPVAIPPRQQCALSHQVWRALLFIFLIFLITSCTSSYAASGILSINHFTVTCANLIMAFHLPPYRQQTKMHWLHIWKQTSMLVFQRDFFFFKCVQTILNLMFISSPQPFFANLSSRHAINNVLYKITCSLWNGFY